MKAHVTLVLRNAIAFQAESIVFLPSLQNLLLSRLHIRMQASLPLRLGILSRIRVMIAPLRRL